MNQVEWMKGICHTWSRGRLISSSLPVVDNWYPNLSSQKRPLGRNLGENCSVRRSGTASRAIVLFVFCLRMHIFPRTEDGKNIRTGGTKYKASLNGIYPCQSPSLYASTRNWELEILLYTAVPKAVLLNPLFFFFFYNIKP